MTSSRIRRTTATLAAALAVLGATASGAAASTTSSVGVAAATSYGFKCSSAYHWVHQNWPNISVRSARNQEVYVRGLLYRWNGRSWINVLVSPWYTGVSNVSGRKQIGWTAGGLAYYFALSGHPSVVPPSDGYNFTHLSPGYYATREQFSAGGRTWATWNLEQSTSATSCAA